MPNAYSPLISKAVWFLPALAWFACLSFEKSRGIARKIRYCCRFPLHLGASGGDDEWLPFIRDGKNKIWQKQGLSNRNVDLIKKFQIYKSIDNVFEKGSLSPGALCNEGGPLAMETILKPVKRKEDRGDTAILFPSGFGKIYFLPAFGGSLVSAGLTCGSQRNLVWLASKGSK